MKAAIYIIEGADGTGKTTLCEALHRDLKGTFIHTPFHDDIDRELYNIDVLKIAIKLLEYGDNVIIDRWGLTELMYGKVFRGGPTFDVEKLISTVRNMDVNIIWIYCQNEEAILNHDKNKKNRSEMYPDIKLLINEYDEYIKNSTINWQIYDFNKINTEQFINNLKGE